VLERLHAGLGKPLSDGKWPGYSKRFLAAIDAAMTVKPEERPQSIADWLGMFGKTAGQSTDEADDEATRFYAAQVAAEDIVPVPPTPNVTAPVKTDVPNDPKQASFKRAGQETRASRKAKSEKEAAEKEAAEKAEQAPDRGRTAIAATQAAATPPGIDKTPKRGEAVAEKKKPSTAMMAGAAAAVLAVVGVGALTLRGGSSQPQAESVAPTTAESPETVAALGGTEPVTTDLNAVSTETQNATAPGVSEPPAANDALRKEQAKSAAAEAQLAALRRAQARAATAPAGPGAPTPPTRLANRKTATPAEAASSTEDSGGGVSAAKMAQFNASVDDARSLARQAMRSNNKQNAQLAKNYDKYLKTLKDSMRGVQSDREADKLIKQAGQTRAYIQFLLREQ
jgi:non-specific serine/threonine protein kinase